MSTPETACALCPALSIPLEDGAQKISCASCPGLGAALAYAGVRRAVTLFHGPQSCAQSIQLSAASHFREPVVVVSSGCSGGSQSLGRKSALRHSFSRLVREYEPELVGIVSSVGTEVPGEDSRGIHLAVSDRISEGWPLVAVVSASESGSDIREGFRAALRAMVQAATSIKVAKSSESPLAVFPSLLSPADIHFLKLTFSLFQIPAVLVSDYSDTLDGGLWSATQLLSEGGTSVSELAKLSHARASIELGCDIPESTSPLPSGARYLQEVFGVPRYASPLPIGIRASDSFYKLMSMHSSLPVPDLLLRDRSRLLDLYIDAHTLLMGKRVLLCGDRDLREALAAFCTETGLVPVMEPGGEGGQAPDCGGFGDIDLVIGNSRGVAAAKRLSAPIVRLGFPIHDRWGGPRMKALGYEGGLELMDRILNALIG